MRATSDRPTVERVIRDVAELRENGQVSRRLDELDVDVATWRAGMRSAARREGMRIRTFLVEPADPLTNPDDHPGDPLGQDNDLPPETLVYAVRTDLPVDRAKLAAAVNALPVPPGLLDQLNRPPADVVSLTERRDATSRPDPPDTDGPDPC